MATDILGTGANGAGQCSGETSLADPGEDGMGSPVCEMIDGAANNFLELHMHEEPPDSNLEGKLSLSGMIGAISLFFVC